MSPCIDGWWKCCQCSCIINPAVDGDSCCDSDHGHRRCVCCSVIYGNSTDGQKNAIRPSPDPGPLQYPRARSKQLALYLNSSLIQNVCADSGSAVNCISIALANKLCILFERHACVFDLPIKGITMESIGMASISCRFPDQLQKRPPFEGQVQFFVFRFLPHEVIVGRMFLRETQTLDLFPGRLEDIKNNQKAHLKINSVGKAQEYIQCWLNGRPLISLPDTGSDVNAISTDMASSLGYRLDENDSRANNGRIQIEFADRSRMITRGYIELTVAFCPPAECDLSTHHLVDLDNLNSNFNYTPSKMEMRPFRRNSQFLESFHVIDDLLYDVVLSETFLYTVKAYTEHAHSFITPRYQQDQETPCIAIGRKTKPGEGIAPIMLPRTEKQVLTDMIANASDAYQKEIEDADELLNAGFGDEEHIRTLKARAKQNWVEFLSRNRELLERHFPGYYEKHVPQEIS